MNRLILWLAFLSVMLCGMLSCISSGETEESGHAYIIKGTVMLDSTWQSNGKLMLFVDNHRVLRQDTIALTPEGIFEYVGHTAGLDELYLCGEQGEIGRFYASGNMEVNLSVTYSENQGVSIKFTETPLDSINPWLQANALLEDSASSDIKGRLESLIKANPNDVRVTLLLRDQLALVNDSLYVRQSLGGLSDEAKPDWLKKSVDATLTAMSQAKKSHNYRLQNAAFECKDTLVDLSTSRSDYMLICFWADYSKPSIDSMRALSDLVEKQYDHKRVSFMSCCLHAEDSLMWKYRITFQQGHHAWIKGGFSDMRMRAWNVKQVPSVILMDMYCNQMQKDVWGADLRKALDRVPGRIGYIKK